MLDEQIRIALARNAQQLNPITISWKRRIRDVHNDGFVGDDHQRLSWQDGMIYLFSSKSRKGSPDSEIERAFDGSINYTGEPNDSPPRLTKESVTELVKTNPDGALMDQSYFLQAGFRLSTSAGEMVRKEGAKSEILRLLDGGGRLTNVTQESRGPGQMITRVMLTAPNPEQANAANCDLSKLEEALRGPAEEKLVQIEILQKVRNNRELPRERIYLFDLDPKINYAIVYREERYSDDRVLLRIINNDFHRVEGRDVWFPFTSTTDQFDDPIPGKSPFVQYTYEVLSVDVHPMPKERFALRYTAPGTDIWDETAPGKPLWFSVPITSK